MYVSYKKVKNMKKKVLIIVSTLSFCLLLAGLFNRNYTQDYNEIDYGAFRMAEGILIGDAVVPLADMPNEEISLAQKLINETNKVRVEHGLNELLVSKRLTEDAKIRAEELPIRWSHTRPNDEEWYTVDSIYMYGENLARGYKTEKEVIDAWMNSPTHKDNILFTDFQTIGIYTYTDDNGTIWIAQEFGY